MHELKRVRCFRDVIHSPFRNSSENSTCKQINVAVSTYGSYLQWPWNWGTHHGAYTQCILSRYFLSRPHWLRLAVFTALMTIKCTSQWWNTSKLHPDQHGISSCNQHRSCLLLRREMGCPPIFWERYRVDLRIFFCFALFFYMEPSKLYTNPRRAIGSGRDQEELLKAWNLFFFLKWVTLKSNNGFRII